MKKARAILLFTIFFFGLSSCQYGGSEEVFETVEQTGLETEEQDDPTKETSTEEQDDPTKETSTEEQDDPTKEG